jgi:hypothetical protein
MQDTEASLAGSNVLLCQHRISTLVSKGWDSFVLGAHPLDMSENKGVSPYIPLQAGYRSKKQNSTRTWLHVTSLAISFPQCYMTFMFQFFKFYLFAMPSFPPTTLSEHRLVCFFFGPPPCYTSITKKKALVKYRLYCCLP